MGINDRHGDGVALIAQSFKSVGYVRCIGLRICRKKWWYQDHANQLLVILMKQIGTRKLQIFSRKRMKPWQPRTASCVDQVGMLGRSQGLEFGWEVGDTYAECALSSPQLPIPHCPQ